MTPVASWLPAIAVAAGLGLLVLRQAVGDRHDALGALVDGPPLPALAAALFGWAAPAWIGDPLASLLTPVLLFLVTWGGVEVGCGLDLRVVRRAPTGPLLYDVASGLAAVVALYLVAHALHALAPATPAPAPALLLGLAAVCVAAPAMPAVAGRRSRRGFWVPSLAPATAVLLAAVGTTFVEAPLVETVLPGGAVATVLLDGTASRLLWSLAVGWLAGLLADLATKDDFAPGGLYAQLAAVVLLAAGVTGALGLDALLVGAAAGFWLVNATLRRLDLLHVQQRGSGLPRRLLPLAAGWMVGATASGGGVALAPLVFAGGALLLLRPAVRLLARRMRTSGATTARGGSESIGYVRIGDLGLLVALGLTRWVEPPAGAAVVAGVLLAQWLLQIAVALRDGGDDRAEAGAAPA